MVTADRTSWVAPETPQIVVAVRPGLDLSAALRFAAYEALDRRCPVHVIHVLALRTPGAPARPVPLQETAAEAEARRAGAGALLQAIRQLEDLLGEGWPTSTELAHGPVERTLTSSARQAQMVVLQQEPAHRVPSPLLDLIAARAPAPVVVVPAGWRGIGSGEGLVVVGVDDPVTDAGTVRWAIDLAERSGGQVRLVHSWWSSDLYEQAGQEVWPGWDQAAELRANLERRLYDAVGVVTTVPVEVVVEHGDPREVLCEQAHNADLVVIGRRAVDTGRLHLGPIAKALVHRATCPVAVVATHVESHPAGRARPAGTANVALEES